MRVADIRSQFLDFFRQRKHTLVPSSSVVPHDDPTLLFANAGMNQFKKVFTGEERRDYRRAASSQKCIRAGGKHNDLENVGYTARHFTFFEMLGNFSFGDYFKSEACAWAWELLTKDFRLDPKDLWVSVFHEDDEARAVWRDEVGVPEERILGLGEKDNFWSMGDVGPCGPCSEIHFDRGESASCGPDCALGVCDCDRFLEVWNLVFMQYEQHADGSREPLPKPSIDTGMGLERIAMVLQGKNSVYEIDLLARLVERVAELADRPYREGAEGTPHRVIADHVRSLAFAIADGEFPSNEGAGYVLRRLLRRAARYGFKLGQEEPFIHRIVDTLAEEMGDAYPELREQQELVKKLIRKEEEQFGRTLKLGMSRFQEEVEAMGERDADVFPAEAAFFLHDTCGFPIDLTEQMAREIDASVDRTGFDRLMEGQRERARVAAGSGRAVSDASTVTGSGRTIPSDTPATRYLGHHVHEGAGRILALEGEADALTVVLDDSPFYAESGGQIGDTGIIRGDGFELRVTDTRKNEHGVYLHFARLASGSLDAVRKGMEVESRIDLERRLAIQRNHTATHLLHAALRTILGTHVQQKGSLVAPDRLRFDLSHFERISPEEIQRVEELVQAEVLADKELVIGEYEKDEALARGAMAFFGEKYGDRVRVVEVPGFSLELCGGAHVARTGEIGGFLVTVEGSAAAGVRRLEAITGEGALERSRENEDVVRELSALLKAQRGELKDKVQGLLREMKELRAGKGRAAEAERDLLREIDGGAGERETAGEWELISASWPEVEMDELRRVGDALKRRSGRRVFILATADDSGVRFVVGTSADAPKGAVHAGKIASAGAKILGGGGGGRPDLAQAGGKDAEKLTEALERMRALAREAVSS